MHSTFVNSYATTFQHLVYPQVRSGEENVRIISFVGDNPTRISIYRHIPCEYSNFKLDSVQYYCAETVQQCTWKDRKKKNCATTLVTVTVKGHSTPFKLLNCTSFTSRSSSSSTLRVKREREQEKEEGGKQEEKRGVRGRQEGERRR